MTHLNGSRFFVLMMVALCASCTERDAPVQTSLVSITEANFAEAETAKNFRNWASRGANEGIAHMRELPPRGNAAPTIQMNDDTLYSVVITEADENGMVTFTIPDSDVYMAVQVVNEGGHGEHYVVEDGRHTVKVASKHAFLIYRSGMEKGIEAARAAQARIPDDSFKLGTYVVKPFDYEEVQEWVEKYREETRDYVLEYTFPRNASEITDLHQWNLENANGWGGSSPEVGVANKYTNSIFLEAGTCYSTTFEDPESVYFTSVTAYDYGRYLMEGVNNVSFYTWDSNADGTITVSFNCGDEVINNIDTKGEKYSFTMRYYGVSQKVLDGKVSPTKTVVAGG